MPLTPTLFQALLAARHLLGGGKPDADPVRRGLSRSRAGGQ
ncbi:MAG: hypothetical protein U0736_06715 [Gemmataceae bacterium]